MSIYRVVEVSNSRLLCAGNNKLRRAFYASAGPRRAAQHAMRAESLSTPRHGGRSSSTAAQSLTAASTRALDGYITGRSLSLHASNQILHKLGGKSRSSKTYR